MAAMRPGGSPAPRADFAGAFPFLRSSVQDVSPKRKRGRTATRPRLRFGLTKRDLRRNGNALGLRRNRAIAASGSYDELRCTPESTRGASGAPWSRAYKDLSM